MPPPIDGTASFEGLTHLRVSVTGDEVLVVVPGQGDLRAVTRAELVSSPGYAFTGPERMFGADDAFVCGVDLHIGSGTEGQGAAVVGRGTDLA
jgi:hypothetical protein